MKQNFISEQMVIDEMKKAIVETLSAKEETIKPESSLINDIGAESLDFLDINYRLEQGFGIKMARHFILEHIEEMFG
ncbi:MAG: phosphopantetheine-binding protein, partial [Nitrospinota bacterium]|nr:phosphopantetheine-binding protein [Nitrospinota bacterium]